jgi:hypothetical protein
MAKGVELGQPCAALCARAPLHNPGHLEQLLKMLVAEVGPCMLLDPGPGLHIIGINEAYAKATMTAPADLRGQCLFDVFPDNPDDPLANGVANLYSSLTIAARHAEPHAMAIQRYDIRDRHGNFAERYWRPINTPLFDDNGVVLALMHRVDDVIVEIRARMVETIGGKRSLES